MIGNLFEKLDLRAKEWLFLIVLVFGFMGIQFTINNLTSVVKVDASTYYAKDLITKSLEDASSKEEVIENIEMWKKNGWTAQLSALNVNCELDKVFVNSLVGASNTAEICRLVN